MAEKGEGSGLGRSASLYLNPGICTLFAIPRDRRSETRPNPSFSSQRRFYSDGRAGNLHKDALAPRRGMDRTVASPVQQPVPIPGDPMARNPEEPTRHRKGRKGARDKRARPSIIEGLVLWGGLSILVVPGEVAERGRHQAGRGSREVRDPEGMVGQDQDRVVVMVPVLRRHQCLLPRAAGPLHEIPCKKEGVLWQTGRGA
jgi:hypothetical protein